MISSVFASIDLGGTNIHATLEVTEDLVHVRNDRDPQLVLADILSRITPSRLLSKSQ